MESETLENRLQKRIYVSLYALLFLTVLLGLSVILEGCTIKNEMSIKQKHADKMSASLVTSESQAAPTHIEL